MKIQLASLILILSSYTTSALAGTPLPEKKPDSETVTVTAPRLTQPGAWTLGQVGVSTPAPAPIVGGGPSAEGNENNVDKAKDEKSKNLAYINDVIALVIDKAGLKAFLKKIAEKGADGDFGFRITHYRADGSVDTDMKACFHAALRDQSSSGSGCTQVIGNPTPNGMHIEFHKIEVQGNKLIYSTDHTLTFDVSSEQEFYALMDELDPSVGF